MTCSCSCSYSCLYKHPTTYQDSFDSIDPTRPSVSTPLAVVLVRPYPQTNDVELCRALHRRAARVREVSRSIALHKSVAIDAISMLQRVGEYEHEHEHVNEHEYDHDYDYVYDLRLSAQGLRDDFRTPGTPRCPSPATFHQPSS